MIEKQQDSLYEAACRANPQEMSRVTEKAFNEIIAFHSKYLSSLPFLGAVAIGGWA